jgi:HPr kinase/phosphorylase
MRSITVRELHNLHAARLGLGWVAGHHGGDRTITNEGVRPEKPRPWVDDDLIQTSRPAPEAVEISPSKSLIGHLNLIHPNRVQVLGMSEIRYLNNLRDISRQDAARQLYANEPDCIIVAEGQPVPENLRVCCDQYAIPMFVSELSSDRIIDALHYHLTNALSEVVTLHGVFMEVTAVGVLLTGPSGVGKSELALELITRGHRLVADDAPEFSRIAPDIINGRCPRSLSDFLEVRGIGIINVRQLFGDSAIKGNKYLRFIIRLQPMDNEQLRELDRLSGTHSTRRILDIDIPEITIPVGPGRNLAVLVECAVRNHILRMSGYDSTEAFSARQRDLMMNVGGTGAEG